MLHLLLLHLLLLLLLHLESQHVTRAPQGPPRAEPCDGEAGDDLLLLQAPQEDPHGHSPPHLPPPPIPLSSTSSSSSTSSLPGVPPDHRPLPVPRLRPDAALPGGRHLPRRGARGRGDWRACQRLPLKGDPTLSSSLLSTFPSPLLFPSSPRCCSICPPWPTPSPSSSSTSST